MRLSELSDSELVSQLRAICADGHRLTARLVAHLLEVEERRLHLRVACSSMFDFCVRRLGMSEGAAFRRINAARLVRRFPAILEHIASGSIHLSSLVLLRDHLTEANVGELIAAASGKNKRALEELIARHAPRPDVPCTIRKLPTRSVTPPPVVPGGPAGAALDGPQNASTNDAVANAGLDQETAATSVASGCPVSAARAPSMAAGDASRGPSSGPSPSSVASPSPQASSVASPSPVPSPSPSRANAAAFEALAEARYKLALTVSREVRDKLERARDLMRHRHPDGDVGVVLEHALDALLHNLERERLASASRPPAVPRAAKASRVTSAVRRAVFARDGEQCTFVDAEGRRCPSRSLLELDHVDARALGGANDAANLRVRCRPHNRLHAEEVFGREHIARRIRSRQQKPRTTAPLVAHAGASPPPTPRAFANESIAPPSASTPW